MTSWRAAALILVALSGCTVPDLLSDRPCPCGVGWYCDDATSRCVRGDAPDAPIDVLTDTAIPDVSPHDTATLDVPDDAIELTDVPTSRPTVYARRSCDGHVQDGLLTEPSWRAASWIEFTNPRSDNTVRVAVAWSTSALCVAFEVFDPSVEGGAPELWNNDGVEVLLDPMYLRPVRRVAAEQPQVIVTSTGIATATYTASAASAVGGYTIEISIPWARLAITPSVGHVMGALFGNNDRDAGARELIDWLRLIDIDGGTSYFQPNLWGDLVLTE